MEILIRMSALLVLLGLVLAGCDREARTTPEVAGRRSQQPPTSLGGSPGSRQQPIAVQPAERERKALEIGFSDEIDLGTFDATAVTLSRVAVPVQYITLDRQTYTVVGGIRMTDSSGQQTQVLLLLLPQTVTSNVKASESAIAEIHLRSADGMLGPAVGQAQVTQYPAQIGKSPDGKIIWLESAAPKSWTILNLCGEGYDCSLQSNGEDSWKIQAQ